jgi:hypothetical protein
MTSLPLVVLTSIMAILIGVVAYSITEVPSVLLACGWATEDGADLACVVGRTWPVFALLWVAALGSICLGAWLRKTV